MRTESLLVTVTLAALTVVPVGCARERHEAVPPSAQLGAEGDKQLTYTTPGPGTIYIYDQADNKLLYSGRVQGRRQVAIDPERNEITVDGVLVQDKTLRQGHTYKIFFLPSNP